MKAQTQHQAQNLQSKATKTFSAINILEKERKRLLLKDSECIN